nr:hypothetical protein [Devosia nitrariae]
MDAAKVDEGTSNQLREKPDEEAVVDEPGLDEEALSRIDEKGDLLESIKRNRKWKGDLWYRQSHAGRLGEVGHYKRRVFEVPNEREIAGHADTEQDLAKRLLPVKNDRPADRVVRQDAADEDQQIGDPPGSEEPERRQNEPDQNAEALAKTTKYEKAGENNRQE